MTTIKVLGKRAIERMAWRLGLDVRLARARGRSREAHEHGWLIDLAPRTIIDIGAHVGAYTALYRDLFPGARFYCFEPLPDAYAELTARFAAEDRVTTFNIALGARDGRAEFHESSGPESSSLLEMAEEHKQAWPHTANSKSMSVEVRQLDSLLDELEIVRPSVAKIDVQGGELDVIRGGKKVLEQLDVLLIETSFAELYRGQPLFKDVYATLVALGFDYHGAYDQLRHPTSRRVLQQDAIFARTDSVQHP